MKPWAWAVLLVVTLVTLTVLVIASIIFIAGVTVKCLDGDPSWRDTKTEQQVNS